MISRAYMKDATLLAEMLEKYIPRETQYVLDEGATPEQLAAYNVPAVKE